MDSAFGGIQGIVVNVFVFHDAAISIKLFLGKLLLLHYLKKGESIECIIYTKDFPIRK